MIRTSGNEPYIAVVMGRLRFRALHDILSGFKLGRSFGGAFFYTPASRLRGFTQP